MWTTIKRLLLSVWLLAVYWAICSLEGHERLGVQTQSPASYLAQHRCHWCRMIKNFPCQLTVCSSLICSPRMPWKIRRADTVSYIMLGAHRRHWWRMIKKLSLIQFTEPLFSSGALEDHECRVSCIILKMHRWHWWRTIKKFPCQITVCSLLSHLFPWDAMKPLGVQRQAPAS